LLSGTALLSGAILFSSNQSQAACSFGSPTGDTSYSCDSGTSVGGLTDTDGSNTLALPPGGTGIIDGNVSFGAGIDTIEMHSGTIDGSVNQGNELDEGDDFIISGGTVTGNVQQGSGRDHYEMTGGQIQSLSQGDNLDTFRMTG